jgi:hypothetical protein
MKRNKLQEKGKGKSDGEPDVPKKTGRKESSYASPAAHGGKGKDVVAASSASQKIKKKNQKS